MLMRPTITRRDGWLRLEARVPRVLLRRRTGLHLSTETLATNGALPGDARIALASARAEILLYVESPILRSEDESTREHRLAADFAAAAALLEAVGHPKPAPAGRSSAVERRESEAPILGASDAARWALDDDDASVDLAGLCSEAGWSFETRGDGALAVDLGVDGAYVAAIVTMHGAAVAVEACLVAERPHDEHSGEALARLLLRANGAFRGARAAFLTRGEAWEAALQATFPARVGPEGLESALGAVAVMARHCAREARLLAEDTSVARAYLDRSRRIGRGLPRRAPDSSPTAGVG